MPGNCYNKEAKKLLIIISLFIYSMKCCSTYRFIIHVKLDNIVCANRPHFFASVLREKTWYYCHVEVNSKIRIYSFIAMDRKLNTILSNVAIFFLSSCLIGACVRNNLVNIYDTNNMFARECKVFSWDSICCESFESLINYYFSTVNAC